MKNAPRMITKSTIATLIVVITMLTRLESFVPSTSRVVSTVMSSSTPQSTSMPPIVTVVGTSAPNWVKTVSRYSDQPLPTTADATANSSTRSQPMIQAMNSPKVA
jgi:hypothetical protein